MPGRKYDTKSDQTKGDLKEGFGKVTGDRKLETEGLAERTIVKGKRSANDVKESTESTVEGVKKVFHKGN